MLVVSGNLLQASDSMLVVSGNLLQVSEKKHDSVFVVSSNPVTG